MKKRGRCQWPAVIKVLGKPSEAAHCEAGSAAQVFDDLFDHRVKEIFQEHSSMIYRDP
jgi:hypothetical protein